MLPENKTNIRLLREDKHDGTHCDQEDACCLPKGQLVTKEADSYDGAHKGCKECQRHHHGDPVAGAMDGRHVHEASEDWACDGRSYHRPQFTHLEEWQRSVCGNQHRHRNHATDDHRGAPCVKCASQAADSRLDSVWVYCPQPSHAYGCIILLYL